MQVPPTRKNYPCIRFIGFWGYLQVMTAYGLEVIRLWGYIEGKGGSLPVSWYSSLMLESKPMSYHTGVAPLGVGFSLLILRGGICRNPPNVHHWALGSLIKSIETLRIIDIIRNLGLSPGVQGLPLALNLLFQLLWYLTYCDISNYVCAQYPSFSFAEHSRSST